MKKLRIRIFDIDGTITHPNIDLWYLVTKYLSSDVECFEKHLLAWKNKIKEGFNSYIASKEMMLKGINLMPTKIESNDVISVAKHFSKNIIRDGNYFKEAIIHINNSIDKGYYIIFSTANYCEVGLGFLDTLLEFNMIKKDHIYNILISGSRIDWKNKKIIHFNMGDYKIGGICERLNLTEEELLDMVDSFYVDDLIGNDSGFLKLSSRGFVIRNDKNKNSSVPNNILLTDWSKIIGSDWEVIGGKSK